MLDKVAVAVGLATEDVEDVDAGMKPCIGGRCEVDGGLTTSLITSSLLRGEVRSHGLREDGGASDTSSHSAPSSSHLRQVLPLRNTH